MNPINSSRSTIGPGQNLLQYPGPTCQPSCYFNEACFGPCSTGLSASPGATQKKMTAWAVGIVIRCNILVLHPYLGGWQGFGTWELGIWMCRELVEHPCTFLAIDLSISLSIHTSIYSSIKPLIYAFIYIFVYFQYVHLFLSIYPSICLSIYRSIYLANVFHCGNI